MKPEYLKEYAADKAAKEAVAKLSIEIQKQMVERDLRSQAKLGKAIGVCQSTISRFLSNPDGITLLDLRKIIRTLGIKPVYMLRALGYPDKEIRDIGKEVCRCRTGS